jgi:hypothetical protein
MKIKETFYIKSKFNLVETTDKIKNIIDNYHILVSSFKQYDKPFHGDFKNNIFKIWLLGRRNTIQVNGKISQNSLNETIVELKLFRFPLRNIIIFSIILIIIINILFILEIFPLPAVLFFTGAGTIFSLITFFNMQYESKKVKECFISLLSN